MSRALNQTRIKIMEQFDDKSLEYRALKYYWKFILKDSQQLSLKAFYDRTFRETLTPRECLNKIFTLVPELKDYYDLYQLLLFHLQEKNTDQFWGLIQDTLPHLNRTFNTALSTFTLAIKTISLTPLNCLILTLNLRPLTNSSKISNAMPLVTRTLTISRNVS